MTLAFAEEVRAIAPVAAGRIRPRVAREPLEEVVVVRISARLREALIAKAGKHGCISHEMRRAAEAWVKDS